MGLSSDLISQFVKATNDNDKKTKKETTNYGVIKVGSDGSQYVQLDGSEVSTPISSTVGVKDGDRVIVMIKNHTAIVTGNLSDPSAKVSSTVEANELTKLEMVLADQINTEKLRVDDLIAEDVKINGTLNAYNTDITNLSAKNAEIEEKLTADEASISELQTDKLDAYTASITYATIDNLDTTNANLYNLTSSYGEFVELTTDNFEAVNSSINNLSTNKLDAYTASITYATIGSVEALYGDITNLEGTFSDFKVSTTDKLAANEASIKDLQTNKLSASDIEGKYANIDFSNISKATMQYFYAESGLIEDVVIGDTTITGKLVGVTISGDLIEGNTVKAEKLVIKGTDGLYYKLNTDGVTTEVEQTDENSLNGQVIKAKSITATKISVSDLVAFDATIGGFHITENSIYSGVKETATNSTRGVYLDNDGQASFGDATNFVKYYKDQNGNYKLEISANSVLIGTSKKNVETAINEVSSAAEAAQTAADNAQADVDAVETRLSSAETMISQNTEAIALRATKTELNETLSGYYTKEQVDSALTVKANEISSNVSSTYATKTSLEETDAKIDNLEIGGRNYLINTSNTWSNDITFSGWQYYKHSASSVSHTDLIGQTVTFSGYIKNLSGPDVGMMLHIVTPDRTYGYVQSTSTQKISAGNEGYISHTFTIPDDISTITEIKLAIRHYNSSDGDTTSQIKSWKLEKGNKATDWSPAPEDMATNVELSAIESRVATAETNITQNTTDISLRATKTEVSTAKSEAISTAASDATTKANNALASAKEDATTKANNAISTAASDATTKANNALASAKSYADAQIKVSADSISSTVTSVKSTADTALSTANAAQKQKYHTASGTSGTAGYVGLAQLTVTGTYVNSPILFGLSNRGQQSSNVSFCFKSTNSKDPDLLHIQTDGGIKVWAYKSGTSTWELIVQKSEAWDEIYVNDFSNPRPGVTVEWTNTLYTELPTENITAATVLIGKVAKSVVDNMSTQIAQNADSISAVATRTTSAETKITTLEQTAEGFTASLATTNANVTTAQSTANTARTEAANAAKTATNYLNFSSNGLVVGDMTASSLGKNVLIDSDSVDIRNGSSVLASFGANKVTLGRNAEDSEIDLCNGAGRISANTASASTSYPNRNAILIDSQEIETESVRFEASTSNTYGASSTPTIQRGTELYMLRSSGSAESCARLKAEHKTTSSGAYTNSGVSAMTYDDASKTRLLAFASDSANSTYNQVNLYPTKTTMNKPLVLNGITYTGKNKILWSGGYYLSETQTATLSEAISAQPNGIVLVWSYYADGASDNSNFRPYFIPKQFVASHPGKGISMFMTNGTMSIAASKYAYISDTSIKGHTNNNDGATAKSCGITSTPNSFVLRYVIGV